MDRYRLLEKELRNYNYQSSTRNEKGSHIAENHGTPYPMIDVFYELGEGKYPESQDGFFLPPEQDEYAEEMFQRCRRYAEGDHEYRFKEGFKPGWMERFRRAWSSFVRDVHFAFLCSVESVFERQEYSIKSDRNDNADLYGWKDDTKYRVSLFVDTSAGRGNLNRKLSSEDENIKDLIVPLNPNGAKYIVMTEDEKLWLYSNTHMRGLKDIIRAGADTLLLEDETTELEMF